MCEIEFLPGKDDDFKIMEMVILVRNGSSLTVKSNTDLNLGITERLCYNQLYDLDSVNLTLVFLFIKLGQGK